MTQGRLPIRLRLIVALDVVAIFLCILAGLAIAALFMPAYYTREEAVSDYAETVGYFGLVPGVPSALLIWGGRTLYLRGRRRLGAALIAAPPALIVLLWVALVR